MSLAIPDVLFQFNEQYEDYLCDDFNVGCDMNDFDDVPDPNAKEKKREVPNLKLTFKELSSSMVNVDPDGYVKKEVSLQNFCEMKFKKISHP